MGRKLKIIKIFGKLTIQNAKIKFEMINNLKSNSIKEVYRKGEIYYGKEVS